MSASVLNIKAGIKVKNQITPVNSAAVLPTTQIHFMLLVRHLLGKT